MSFPMMLAASLALHLGVAGAVALYYFAGTSSSISASLSADQSATVTLIRSVETRVVSHLNPVTSKASVPAFVSTSTAEPLLPAPATPHPSAASLTDVPHETNPNAHVQPLPPEAILSPVPPPILNSANGVVFILDVSGSMYEPYAGSTRLAFARAALGQRILALKDGTPFAITLYAQRAVSSGPLVAASNATREAALRFIQRDVDCGGGTNLPAGLAAAQQLRPGAFVLASDGDLNISAANLETRAADILGEKGHCAHLEIISIAPRTDAGDEQLLQELADQQGGDYSAEQANPSSLVTSAANVTKAAGTTP
jgi:von Willebrand factor type A domain